MSRKLTGEKEYENILSENVDVKKLKSLSGDDGVELLKAVYGKFFNSLMAINTNTENGVSQFVAYREVLIELLGKKQLYDIVADRITELPKYLEVDIEK